MILMHNSNIPWKSLPKVISKVKNLTAVQRRLDTYLGKLLPCS